jgi:hypothetical protein
MAKYNTQVFIEVVASILIRNLDLENAEAVHPCDKIG